MVKNEKYLKNKTLKSESQQMIFNMFYFGRFVAKSDKFVWPRSLSKNLYSKTNYSPFS